MPNLKSTAVAAIAALMLPIALLPGCAASEPQNNNEPVKQEKQEKQEKQAASIQGASNEMPSNNASANLDVNEPLEEEIDDAPLFSYWQTDGLPAEYEGWYRIAVPAGWYYFEDGCEFYENFDENEFDADADADYDEIFVAGEFDSDTGVSVMKTGPLSPEEIENFLNTMREISPTKRISVSILPGDDENFISAEQQAKADFDSGNEHYNSVGLSEFAQLRPPAKFEDGIRTWYAVTDVVEGQVISTELYADAPGNNTICINVLRGTLDDQWLTDILKTFELLPGDPYDNWENYLYAMYPESDETTAFDEDLAADGEYAENFDDEGGLNSFDDGDDFDVRGEGAREF